jgi:cytochrome c oxidase assembly protein subunit 11
MDQEQRKAELARRNKRTGLAAAGLVTFMVGLSFAAVPLYDLFCRHSL